MALWPLLSDEAGIECRQVAVGRPQVFALIDEKLNYAGYGKCGMGDCQEAIDTCRVQVIS